MLKLNVDGSRRAASGCIGTGGVIGGANGDWICGFVVNLGKGVVSLVQQVGTLSCHPLVALIQSCCVLMRRISNCHIAYVYREMNVVADRMTNWSFNLDLGVLLGLA
ncbi:unnamed protein product [Prunus armeniaca]